MDGQDHKTTAISAGHEGNGVHLCHRCGWPFPNPHPSAKHRRAHKKVCGTVAGYKIFTSEEQDQHLASLDDEHASDEDAHTPSPDLVKKKTEGSGKVGEKSNRSEDDVYSDAVPDFPDSGVSSKLEERFESVREVGKSVEQKGVEGDQAADKTEQSNDPKTNEEITNPETLVNGANLSEGVIAVTVTSDKAVSGQDADTEVQDDNLESEEGKLADSKLTAVEKQEESCDKPVSEVVKHDLPPQTETLQDFDASEGANSGARSIETVKVALVDEVHEKDVSVGLKEVPPSTEEIRTVETGEVAFVDENHEKKDDSVRLKEVSRSTEVLMPAGTVGESTFPQQSLDATEPSLLVSSTDQEVKSKTSLDENTGSISASEGEKCDMNGKEKRNLESKESFYFDSVPSFSITSVPEDDQSTSAFKTDLDHCEEKSDSEHLEPGNEKSEGGSVEEHAIPDSTMISDKAADFPSSFAEDSDARNLNGLSKDESIESGRIVSELNRDDIGDVLDKNSSPTVSLENRVISESPNNIHVIENVDRVNSVDVESVSKLKDNIEVESGKDNGCTKDGAKASESTDTTEETAKIDHEVNLASSGAISESKDLTSTVNEIDSSKDFSPSKSISSAELDGNFLVSEIHLVTLTKEAAPPPSDYQTSGTGDDNKTVVNVEGVGSKSLQAEVEEKLAKENDGASAINLSGSSSDRADSMDANCGSVISDTLETNSQKLKTTTEEAQPDKSDTYEPPSFMTLVQPGGEGNQVKGPAEIETGQNNQQPKSDPLQAGWFPSLTNVVNESEGRKKNEEVIAKVTNWSPGKQHHGPLRTLLTEVKSPNTKQVGSETKDENGGATAASKDQDTNKDVEEWNSPARYPIEIKKEKKKGRSLWVPFVCCSSVHRDL